MKITQKLIESLNPCSDRYEHFIANYAGFSGDVVDFISLDHIDFDDKVWVMTRLMTKNQLVRWSIACAESVKHIFESQYPCDRTLTNLFEYMNSIEDFESLTSEQLTRIQQHRGAAYVSYASANAAVGAASASYASVSAVNAANAYTNAYTNAASAAAHAAFAASAYASSSAYAASASAAEAHTMALEEQNNLNLLFLCSLIDE